MCAECRETRKLTLVAESVAGVESVAAEPVRFVVDQDERRIPGGAGEEERSAAQKDQPGTSLNTTGLDQLNKRRLCFMRVFRATVGQPHLLSHDNQPQEDAFKEADVNNDGTLTIEEWTDVLSKTGHDNPRLVTKRTLMAEN